MSPNCLLSRVVVLIFLLLPTWAWCSADEPGNATEPGNVRYQEVGDVEAIREAEHRLGGTDRIFLIEDDWELNRCRELLPKLPKIDTTKESLLVVMSWPKMPRTLKSILSEGDMLVIKLDQADAPLEVTRDYRPPNFLVFQLPAWRGPVRVEINGEPRFTIFRGDELADRASEIWEEILRLHSGGRPSGAQQMRRYKRQWPGMTDDEVRLSLYKNKNKIRVESVSPYIDMLFRDLVDMRAKPIMPRIFALIESMGKHDKAQAPAVQSIVGIGGPEVIEHSKAMLNSWNPRARATAMGLLARFATPDMRAMAREKIAELDQSVSLSAMEILRRLGITKDDVPHLVYALDRVAKYYAKELENPPKLEFYNGEMGHRLIHELGELGPDAAEALPVLERFTTDSRLPLSAYQKHAQEAIDKIRGSKDSQ